MFKLKWFHILIVGFLINFLSLITFGISFDYNILGVNIVNFISWSLLMAILLTIGYEYKINYYFYLFSLTNIIAVLYMFIKYAIYDYSWSALVPTIGYFYILAVGLVISIIGHIIVVLFMKK